MRTMRKIANKELMTPILDDLLNDGRLARLFSKDLHHCALQLWILQIRSEQSTENRVVYGRLLPYSYSNNRWSSSDDDNFRLFGQIQAQLLRLTGKQGEFAAFLDQVEELLTSSSDESKSPTLAS
jgi:hypothetical protein